MSSSIEQDKSKGVLEFKQIIDSKGSEDVIVDVRTPREFSQGHIKGAILLNLNDPSFSHELRLLDKELTYLIYCRSGHRSKYALAKMDELGFKNVYELDNGLIAWKDENFPLVTS